MSTCSWFHYERRCNGSGTAGIGRRHRACTRASTSKHCRSRGDLCTSFQKVNRSISIKQKGEERKPLYRHPLGDCHRRCWTDGHKLNLRVRQQGMRNKKNISPHSLDVRNYLRSAITHCEVCPHAHLSAYAHGVHAQYYPPGGGSRAAPAVLWFSRCKTTAFSQ